VVSKYIGESEKNLERLFARAEAKGAVLLIDEADALLGKRTEVKDAHDRYANLAIDYLLRRIEQYAGLVVLASRPRLALLMTLQRRFSVYDFPPP
jgi:SpoVK/Ycf46/Vps4 family AAA+-type ATPase